MNRLNGTYFSVSLLERHDYICDLINVDVPLLSLYRDERSSWMYLWTDTDGEDRNRWLVFQVGRSELVDYLQKSKTLLSIISGRNHVFCLDATSGVATDAVAERTQAHRTLKRVGMSVIADQGYLPGAESWFDESLTTDIAVTQEIAPARFDVPIAGEWFFSDLDKFSRAYGNLYSFVYCTGPRFVTNIGTRLRKYLAAPWMGGYSRVNLFEALHRLIPSIHDTRIAKFAYASPGEVTIEALASVGAKVRQTVIAAAANHAELKVAVGVIDGILGQSKLRKQNLSTQSDSDLVLPQTSLAALQEQTQRIAQLLDLVPEIAMVVQHAPNSVVATKAVMALVTQVKRVSDYQRHGMLTL